MLPHLMSTRRPDASPNGEPTFTVVIPTSGRATLKRTLRRLRRESVDDIEVVVVSDGEQPLAQRITEKYARGWPSLKYLEGPQTRNWGNAQRMEGIANARGRYLLFIDDDDIHRRGAFRKIRGAVARDPNRIIIFRMNRFGQILPAEPGRLVQGNVGTPQMLVPNLPGQVGSWLTRDRYASDFDFLSECIELQGHPVWHGAVIANAPAWGWASARLSRVRVRLAIRTRLFGLLGVR